MKLYLLKRRLPAGQACGLDEADGFVVRAVDAYDARRYAADWCGDEGRVVWLDEKFSTCTRLHVQGSEGAILRDLDRIAVGDAYSDIARDFGCSPQNVSEMAIRHAGIKRGPDRKGGR